MIVDSQEERGPFSKCLCQANLSNDLKTKVWGKNLKIGWPGALLSRKLGVSVGRRKQCYA